MYNTSKFSFRFRLRILLVHNIYETIGYLNERRKARQTDTYDINAISVIRKL